MMLQNKRRCTTKNTMKQLKLAQEKALQSISDIVNLLGELIQIDTISLYSNDYFIIMTRDVKKILATHIHESKDYQRSKLVALQNVDEYKFYVSNEPDLLKSNAKLAHSFMKVTNPFILYYCKQHQQDNYIFSRECIMAIIESQTSELDMKIEEQIIHKWCITLYEACRWKCSQHLEQLQHHLEVPLANQVYSYL